MKAFYNALMFAIGCHRHGTDKGGEPYINHLITVCSMLDDEEEDVKIIALLHDVVEDCSVSLKYIQETYGSFVADTIELLTREHHKPYMDYILRVATNPIATKVKIADLQHNLQEDRRKNINESQVKKYEAALDWLRKVSDGT